MKFNKLFISSLIIGQALTMFSCKPTKDEPEPLIKKPLEVAAVYDSTNFAANTKVEAAILAQLASLTSEAKKGRATGIAVTKVNLENIYNGGTPSLASVANPYYKNLLEGENGFINQLAKSSGGSYIPSEVIIGEGGVYGTGTSAYLFDENGLEMEQMVEKGLFGAVCFKHLNDLTNGEITLVTVDRMLAIYGAHPAFSNSGSTNVKEVNKRDKALANYAARRDDNNGSGLYIQIKNQFLKLQAAVKAGKDYNDEKNAAIAEIKLLIEKVNFATVINYCFAVKATMSKTSPTNDEKAASLHAYGECVGFVHGWKGLPTTSKRITDAQIDEILVLLNAEAGKTPTSYKFITNPFEEIKKLDTIIAKLKTIYGFTDAEAEYFKMNWVSEKKR